MYKKTYVKSIKDNMELSLRYGEISLSVGTVLFPGCEKVELEDLYSMSDEDLYSMSDAALYEAKNTGKGRIVIKKIFRGK